MNKSEIRNTVENLILSINPQIDSALLRENNSDNLCTLLKPPFDLDAVDLSILILNIERTFDIQFTENQYENYYLSNVQNIIASVIELVHMAGSAR